MFPTQATLHKLINEFNALSRKNADTMFTPFLIGAGEIINNSYYIILNENPSFNGMHKTVYEFATKYNATVGIYPLKHMNNLVIRIDKTN
jgi:hypothetical protein